MTTEREGPGDAERLPESVARRLLDRASELEKIRAAELSVAELREVAREAGIAPSAFERALAELRADELMPQAKPALPTWRRVARFWPAALVIAAFLAFFLLRVAVNVQPLR